MTDAPPPPSGAPSPTPPATPPTLPAPPPRPWRRRLLVALAVVVATPPLFVAFALFRLRHQPWQIPAAWRAPAADVPEPAPAPGAPRDRGLWVTYLGITGYRVTDGVTTVLLDPTPTRPTGLELLRPCESDPALVGQWCPRADFVLVNHAHHDHALDVPNVARATGAQVYGTPSALNLCRSRGVAEPQLHEARPGQRLTLGTFEVDVAASHHTAIAGVENPLSGVVAPDAGPLYWWQFGQDGCLVYRLVAGGASLWFHPTSTYEPGGLGGRTAQTLIVGVTGEPLTAERARALVAECRPRRVLPTHYDNFLQPIGKGLALMLDLDLEAARGHVAAADPAAAWWVLDFGQTIHLPPDAP